MMKLNKNDYQWKTDLRNFANNNVLGRLLKPVGKLIYNALVPYLSYPRDSFLRHIPKGGVCCEIGVYEGVFAERILRKLKPKKLYLIDPWLAEFDTGSKKDTQEVQNARYKSVLEKFAGEIASGRVVVLRKTSDESYADFTDAAFDFVYIDGDHSYEQVTKDLGHFLPKVRDDGILAGDDFHYPSVEKAVRDFSAHTGLAFTAAEQQFLIKK